MNITSKQQGFSLIELMISLGLGLVLSGSVVIVFIQNSRSATQDEEISRTMENGRYVVRTISREIAMSGFWGKFLDISSATEDVSVSVGVDCGDGVNPWAMDLIAVQFLNNATASTAAAAFDCLPSGNVVVGTDILAAKRVADSDTIDADIRVNQMYMRTNGVAGIMFLGSAGAPPAMTGTVTNWAYLPRMYFLRDYSFTLGDGIPSLCRGFLQNSSPPAMSTECLVEGVENLQIEYGVDNDDDSIADYYTATPTASEIFDSVAARIYVLVRSLNQIPNYTNDKAYNLGSVNIAAANDGFFRRVFSTTVILRNPANLGGIGT